MACAATPTAAPVLTLDRVTVGYRIDSPVLTGLSAELSGTGLIELAGPNGSGKSSLLEVIAGTLRPWEGAVEICGEPAHSPDARQLRRVCRTRPSVYPQMSVRDHLHLVAGLTDVDSADVRARATRYGLDPWFGQDASELSAGNLRKLWLMLCTTGDTPLLVLDEPFTALDQHSAEVLRSEIARWSRQRLVLLIDHQGACTQARSGYLDLTAPRRNVRGDVACA